MVAKSSSGSKKRKASPPRSVASLKRENALDVMIRKAKTVKASSVGSDDDEPAATAAQGRQSAKNKGRPKFSKTPLKHFALQVIKHLRKEPQLKTIPHNLLACCACKTLASAP
jgi:hypothetical protein